MPLVSRLPTAVQAHDASSGFTPSPRSAPSVQPLTVWRPDSRTSGRACREQGKADARLEASFAGVIFTRCGVEVRVSRRWLCSMSLMLMHQGAGSRRASSRHTPSKPCTWQVNGLLAAGSNGEQVDVASGGGAGGAFWLVHRAGRVGTRSRV